MSRVEVDVFCFNGATIYPLNSRHTLLGLAAGNIKSGPFGPTLITLDSWGLGMVVANWSRPLEMPIFGQLHSLLRLSWFEKSHGLYGPLGLSRSEPFGLSRFEQSHRLHGPLRLSRSGPFGPLSLDIPSWVSLGASGLLLLSRS